MSDFPRIILGVSSTQIYKDTATNNLVLYNNNLNILSLDSSGNVGIGDSSPSYKLDVNGTGRFTSDLTVDANLIVNGTTITMNTETMTIEDPLISLASNNSADIIDSGFYSKYNDGVTKYTGLFRDSSDTGEYKLFKGLITEPTTTVNTSGTGYSLADFECANINLTGDLSINGVVQSFGDTAVWSEASSIASYSGSLNVGATTANIEIVGNNSSIHPSLQLARSGATSYQILNDNGNYELSQYVDGSGIFTDIYTFTGNSHRFLTGGTEKVRINSSGNVGIAVASPTEKLDVQGNITVSGSIYGDSINIGSSGNIISNVSGNMRFNTSGQTNNPLSIGHASGVNVNTDFKVDGDTLFVDVTNDRVGINRTPSWPLDIQGTARFIGTVDSSIDGGGVFTQTYFDKSILLNRATTEYRNYYLGILGDNTTSANKFAIAIDGGGGANPDPQMSLDVKGRMVLADGLSIGTEAEALTITIGDSDTGIDWVSDGNLAIWANNVSVMSITSAGLEVNGPVYSDNRIVHYRDEKSNGSHGGVRSGTGFRARTLNTRSGDTSFTTFTNSTITFTQTGTYKINGRCPGYHVDRFHTRIQQTDDNNGGTATLKYGTSTYNGTGSGASSDSVVGGIFSISSGDVIQLQQYCQVSNGTHDYGVNASSGGTEVYSEMWIERLN